jgi:hypothetical protein
MKHDEARVLIVQILVSEVRFEGHFDKCFDNLKNTQQYELMDWIKACASHKANPIQSKKDREMIGFVKRIGSNLRTILTKQKTGYFIALFLDKHKYYETEMDILGF